MRQFLIAIIAAFLVAAPVTAQAQAGGEQQIGTRFKQKAKSPGSDEVRTMQKRVAKCVLYRDKALVRKVLENSDPVSIYFEETGFDSDELFDELDVDHCLSRAMKSSTYKMYMRIQFRTLRALLAEESYLMENKKPIALADGAPQYLIAREQETGMHPSAVAMAKYADCIVYGAVQESDDLLRARPGSTAEEKAFKALYPVLGNCGLGGSEETIVDPSVVRMLVADGLWSRYHYGTMDVSEAAE